ncbi:MAG: c-type cytochrome [Polyangiales bacterium]
MVVSWLLLGLAGGCRKRERRTWQPSDHGYPPALTAGSSPAGRSLGPQGAAGAGTVTAGPALWQLHCARCHGAQGAGDGPAAPAGVQMVNMRDAAWQARMSDAALTAVVQQGRGLMPAFGTQLSPPQIDVLRGHIRGFAKP